MSSYEPARASIRTSRSAKRPSTLAQLRAIAVGIAPNVGILRYLRARLPQIAKSFRRFGEATASPLCARVAIAISESEEALRTIEKMRKRRPELILAALHDIALAGRAPALAAAFAANDADAAARAAIEALRDLTDAVAEIVARRQVVDATTNAAAVLYPAIAEAARRAGADAVGLIDVGCGAGLNLNVDRVHVTYSNGQSLGDPSSPVRLSSVVKHGSLATRQIPEVVAKVGIDRDPLDLTDADDARWLRALVPPDDQEQAARIDAEIALAATVPIRNDPLEALPEALERVPPDALPVVTTTWALARYTLEDRLRFLQCLEGHRTVAWVSIEGVGVALAIPRLGDRPAFGHSTIGVTILNRSSLHAEAVGRCWSRGRWLSWLMPYMESASASRST
ncbi:MAG TPA: DUF2332 domain-containing protein [Solirubrobacter sp.]|nr:DUF2332 domain-containing protein [Solirubrobacter sp.]